MKQPKMKVRKYREGLVNVEISLMNLILTPGSTFNFDTGLPKGEDLGWRPGQIFQGVVLEQVTENAYILRVDGKGIVAVSPYALAKDQVITIEVQGRSGSNYTVSLLDSVPASEENGLKTIIGQLGVEDNSLNRVLIRGFLSQELPLKPELLRQAARVFQISGGDMPEPLDVNTVLLALKWGVPPRPKVMETIQAFLAGFREEKAGSEKQLSRLVQQLTAFIDEVPVKNLTLEDGVAVPLRQEGVPPVTLSKEGLALLQQVKELLGRMALNPDEGAERVTEQLRSLLASQLPGSLRGSAEFQPEFMFEKAEKTSPREMTKDISQEKQNPGADCDGPKGERNTSGAPEKPGDGHSYGTGGVRRETAGVNGKDLRAFGELLETFGRLLQELRVLAKEANLQKGHSMVQEGAGLERQMAGHQIFQSLNIEDKQQDYLYFNLPFIKGGETETWGQLRIMKDTGGKKVIDPKRFHTAIFLNTENLGPLLLEIKVWNQDITANGKVTEEWVAQMLKKAWPKLQDSFGAMGYCLRQCDWAVGPFEERLEPGELNTAKPGKNLRFLDVRV